MHSKHQCSLLQREQGVIRLQEVSARSHMVSALIQSPHTLILESQFNLSAACLHLHWKEVRFVQESWNKHLVLRKRKHEREES